MAFHRYCEVTVGPKNGKGFKIDGLKIEFSIEKSDTPENNKSTIKIYNLSKDTSSKVTVAGNHIQLRAGYKDETIGAIFFGDVLKGQRIKNGNDYVTELQVFDGRKAVMEGYVKLSYAINTEASTIAREILDAINLPYKGLGLIPPKEKYLHGYSFLGMAVDALREVLNRFGLTYTIQNEMLYIIKPGEAADNTGLKLTPKTGLLTVPQSISDKTTTDDATAEASNQWKFSTMLFPQLIPRLACSVESSTLNGEVIVKKAIYSGSNWDGDFKIDIEAEAV
jgi:hypothetical protein